MHLHSNTVINTRNNSTADNVTMLLFIIYLVALCWILVFKLGTVFSHMGDTRSINLIPFHAPLILNGKADYGESVLNVIVFIPLGVYAGILFRNWTTGKKLFFFFLISFIVEVLQYILAVGTSDITDILTNTFGGLIGLMLFKAVEKIFNSKVKAQKLVNIMAALGTVLVFLFLILLKLNLLPIRYQ